MDTTRGPLIVRVTVFHHARLTLLTSLGAALCAVAAAAKPVSPLASDADWYVLPVGMLLLAAVLLTSYLNVGDQPLSVSAQGLRIGTLFNHVRGEELRSGSIKGSEAKLMGRAVTLKLKAREADGPALREQLATLRITPPSKQRYVGMILGLATGALLVLGNQAIKGNIVSLQQLAVILSTASAIAQSIAWLRFKRAGYRL